MTMKIRTLRSLIAEFHILLYIATGFVVALGLLYTPVQYRFAFGIATLIVCILGSTYDIVTAIRERW